MAEKYFSKFPLTQYANNIVVNIIERAKLTNSVINNPYIYYNYEIKEGERPDQIADFYYNDQYMDWLLYLSNQIVDPYYEWYLPEDTFNSYLVKKYNLGTNINISKLKNKVYYYKNNWYNESRITVSDYNALPYNHHRYWQEVYNDFGNIVSYTRKRNDWTIKTNNIISYTYLNEIPNNFIVNEIVSVHYSNTHVGKGQVASSNSSHVVLQHLSGYVFFSSGYSSPYVYGTESGANVVFNAATSLANNIVVGEEIYWDPISIYDYERIQNESKKSIKVLDRGLSMQVSESLTKLL
jgi:hypothetical protein